jgi:hypothetical protein
MTRCRATEERLRYESRNNSDFEDVVLREVGPVDPDFLQTLQDKGMTAWEAIEFLRAKHGY